MTTTHVVGYPRIGADRELKFALERYWKGTSTADELTSAADAVFRSNIADQASAGSRLVSAGDFSLYDHVLDTARMLGVLPARATNAIAADESPLDTLFRVARGRSVRGSSIRAGEMTKWFDTNYHYIVPEFDAIGSARPDASALLRQIDIAIEEAGDARAVKPVLLGPVTFAYLGKPHAAALGVIERIAPIYRTVLDEIARRGVEWVQIDEPALVLDLDGDWLEAYRRAYAHLEGTSVSILLATYFGGIAHNASTVASLSVNGVHLDAVRGAADLDRTLDALPREFTVSLGVIDGRNVWRADISSILDRVEPIVAARGDSVWLAPSCSLLHVPYDLAGEESLPAAVRPWLAFARQKLTELDTLRRGVEEGRAAIAREIEESDRIASERRASEERTRAAVQERLARVSDDDASRGEAYPARARAQRERLNLPEYPTTTIGSFPQTTEIRRARRAWRRGELSNDAYDATMRDEIASVVREQEELGIDVLVHGEAERNDMVEYFGEHLSGFAFTRNGWVQSYGSRCVKPPIIYGDVERPEPITVDWISYAASLTDRPVKGMLTGPITILQWSFVRDDQSRADTALQIALALRDEVRDLEAAGIGVIQVDEPAVREGLPLRRGEWRAYLEWATRAFRIATAGVRPETQIHTHMCYAEFNDIIEWIAALDADVITIETSRSNMELLSAFSEYAYPNEIGPGVYDIHSPNVPDVDEIVRLMRRAAQHIPPERLWVNPDCGLKTRKWDEVRPALSNMVAAARTLRSA